MKYEILIAFIFSASQFSIAMERKSLRNDELAVNQNQPAKYVKCSDSESSSDYDSSADEVTEAELDELKAEQAVLSKEIIKHTFLDSLEEEDKNPELFEQKLAELSPERQEVGRRLMDLYRSISKWSSNKKE